MAVKAMFCAALGLLVAGVLPAFPQIASPAERIQEHQRKAQEYVRADKPALAAKEYAAIVELDPGNAEARANLGVLLYFQSDYAKAVPQLREGLKLRPGLWKIEALLGVAEQRTGQLEQAREHLEQAFPQLQEEKLRVEMGLHLIEIYTASRDLDKAAGVASVLRQIKPTDPDILYINYRIHTDLADENVVALSLAAPKSARMHQVIAQQEARMGNLDSAIANYREALKIDPKVPGLHYELAELLPKTAEPNKEEQAEKEYQASLTVNPYDALAETRLGKIAATRNEQKAAFDHYSRALALSPDDADANFGLGRTLVTMNQPQKALPYLEKAAKLDPFNATTRFRLGSLYRTLGREEDSRRELAEFQRLRKMKENMKQQFRDLRLMKPEQGEEELPK